MTKHRPDPEKRLHVAAAAALFLSTLDTGIVTLAVVLLALALQSSPAEATWIVTAHALAVCIVLLPAGMVADRLGSLRVFRIGIAPPISGSPPVVRSVPQSAQGRGSRLPP